MSSPAPLLAGGLLLHDRNSVMGLSTGCLEAYALELYSERSTSLLQRRVATDDCGGRDTRTDA